MRPSGGAYPQYPSTLSVSHIHVSNPPVILSSCWVQDFHAAIRWCLPTVSQYFVSILFSREQSSCQYWQWPTKEWNIIRNVLRKLFTPNCNNVVIQKLDLNRKSVTGKIKSFVFLFCLFHFLDLNQILNPFQQLHPLHHERPFSMGMVHRVSSCIQLLLQLLYFPFPMPITEDVVAINGNRDKEEQKKATRSSKQVPLY